MSLFKKTQLNEVFTPGGQPSITYVSRAGLNIEAALKKAVSQRNIIVSLTGPTKSGKTVLCRNVLQNFAHVWIEGGQIKSEPGLWERICYELNYPREIMKKRIDGGTVSAGVSAGAEVGVPGNKASFVVTLGGSKLHSAEVDRSYTIDAMHTALEHLTKNDICLVIDDFHYIPEEARASIIRTLKGAVFNGMKIVLLSTPHRAFEAIKAEAEITGRFKHVTMPSWGKTDLSEIANVGFKALNVTCDHKIVDAFAREAQGSPLLMQQFCWNICYDSGISESSLLGSKINPAFDVTGIFNEVAHDSGLPTYEKFARGPQSRTDRMPRPLVGGGEADIYEAILLAIAVTGPKEKLTYDQIRASLNSVLADKIPQKLEVSNALNHLATIDEKENKGARAIDWDSKMLELVITDPFFRFYLRWKVKLPHP